MRVVPQIKSKSLAPNEARIITIDKAAIEELLLENLLEHKSDYFNVEAISEDSICIMDWDQQELLLTYAVVPIKYCVNGQALDFSKIREKTGITTNSLFKSGRYCSLTLTEAFLKKKI